jgi:hypothetical protein
MPLFKFNIYDLHDKPSIIEEELWFIPDEIEWKVFKLYIDIDFVQITSFRSYALFSGEEVKEVTKVYLSDGSVVFAVNKIETFESNYIKNYLGLIHSPSETPNKS